MRIWTRDRVRSLLSNTSQGYISTTWALIPGITAQGSEFVSRVRKNLAESKKWIATEAAINQGILTWSYTKAWVPIQAAAASIADNNAAIAARLAEQQGLADNKELAINQATQNQIAQASAAEDQSRMNAYQVQENNANTQQQLYNSTVSSKAPWIRKPTESYQQFIRRVLSGN